MIKLFAAIHQPLYREAILHQVLLQPDIELVGESDNGVETIKKIDHKLPSVLIIEETLPDNDGLTVSEVILEKHPTIAVLLLVERSISKNRLSIYLESGIKTVVAKTQSIKDLIAALYYIRSGQVFINPKQFSENNGEWITQSIKSLSSREFEVAMMIAKRKNIPDIANLLGVSSKTVHTYKERILVKLNCDRLSELTLLMQRFLNKRG